MLTTTVILHILINEFQVAPPRKPLIFEYDTISHIFLFESERGALHRYPSRQGIWTGEKHVFILYFWRCLPVGVPKRCAERIRDLTNCIVRTNVYPVAYSGFSDVWSCYLQRKQSPTENVCFAGKHKIALTNKPVFGTTGGS